MPPSPFEEVVGYERIETHYAEALRGPRRYKKEAVLYDLYRELNNVQLWRDLRAGRYVPGPYHKTIITEPKRRELSIPQLRDKIVQLTIHEELQNLFRPVFRVPVWPGACSGRVQRPARPKNSTQEMGKRRRHYQDRRQEVFL